MKMRIRRLLGLAVVGLVFNPVAAPAQEATTREREPAQMLAPEQAGILLLEQRDELEHPERTRDFMGLQDGDLVADIGCGNGYYTLRLAERTGPHGVVFAVDVQQGMLDQLESRMQEHEVSNVYPILGTYDDPYLPPGKIDWILLVDAYHEFSKPEAMLARMKEALAPGGRVALLEYRSEQDPATIPFPIPPAHKMSVEQVLREWQPAGFELVQLAEFLPAQHLFVFKVEGDASRPDIHRLEYSDIGNLSTFGNVVYFSAQPTEEDIEALGDLGVKTVINLRTPEEMASLDFDEKAAVESAGMRYVHAPMGGELPSGTTWEAIQQALKSAEGEGPVLMHCRSGNRVGAAWALYAGQEQGMPTDKAIEEGRAAGMKAPVFEDGLKERLKN